MYTVDYRDQNTCVQPNQKANATELSSKQGLINVLFFFFQTYSPELGVWLQMPRPNLLLQPKKHITLSQRCTVIDAPAALHKQKELHSSVCLAQLNVLLAKI